MRKIVCLLYSLSISKHNVENQLYCEAYAAGVNHLNRSYECFNGDLTEKELQIERGNVHIIDRENNNPVLDMINYVMNNYQGKPKIITNKHGIKDLIV